MQAKLLRVLESKAIERLGGEDEVPLEVRIIAASNKNIPQLVKEGKFREDLYYRLNVITIHMPNLSERSGDILRLAEKFIADFSTKLGKKVKGLQPEAAAALVKYDWPGNVRELQNVMERAVVLLRGDLITLKELPGISGGPDAALPVSERLADLEKEQIKKVLDRMEWNIGKSAEILGIHRNTLRLKIKEYGLSSEN
jgi:transcriptional regulator with PAS, ATPase and Fis domain